MSRPIIRLGLAVVAVCAVVLSFSALYDLARLCGFDVRLAALVPVLADAGAAVATAVWLAGDATRGARRYARVLALALLAASVVGNAGAHALVAAGARPHWVVVVAVGALAPTVLAATLHLYALFKVGGDAVPAAVLEFVDEVAPLGLTWPPPPLAGGEVAAAGDDMASAGGDAGEDLATAADDGFDRQGDADEPDDDEPDETSDPHAEARALAAAGAGRPRLVALGLTDHQARQIIRDHRQTTATPVPAGNRRKATR